MPKPDIWKAAGVIIRDRKLLVNKSAKYDFYLSPGGKIELGETPAQSLIRELKEELNIDVTESDFYYTSTIEEPAANDPSKILKMEIFFVNNWRGELKASNEIIEIKWIDSTYPRERLGSVIASHIIPDLKAKNLID
ncbi:MAG: NUDIX domain-containing protein [Patescibacteria group bacterium]